MYSLGLNIAPRICFTLVKSLVKNIRRFKQEVSRFKMDFTVLLNSALKFVTLSKLIAVRTPQITNSKIDVLRTANVRWLNLRAECPGSDSSAVF
jgi:hypothetical protein